MSEKFKLEIQNPNQNRKKENIHATESHSKQQSEELIDQIQSATIVSEFQDAILDSENQVIIAPYVEMRFEHLKATNTFIDNDEAHLNNLELEKFTGVDDNGFLKIGNEVTETRIDIFEDRKSDAEFLAKTRPEILRLLNESEELDLAA